MLSNQDQQHPGQQNQQPGQETQPAQQNATTQQQGQQNQQPGQPAQQNNNNDFEKFKLEYAAMYTKLAKELNVDLTLDEAIQDNVTEIIKSKINSKYEKQQQSQTSQPDQANQQVQQDNNTQKLNNSEKLASLQTQVEEMQKIISQQNEEKKALLEKEKQFQEAQRQQQNNLAIQKELANFNLYNNDDVIRLIEYQEIKQQINISNVNLGGGEALFVTFPNQSKQAVKLSAYIQDLVNENKHWIKAKINPGSQQQNYQRQVNVQDSFNDNQTITPVTLENFVRQPN